MVNRIVLLFASLLISSALLSQFSEFVENRASGYFEDQLLLHTITEGIDSEGSLYEAEITENQNEIAKILVDYPYQSDNPSAIELKNKDILLDIVLKGIKKKQYAEAFTNINKIKVSDLSDHLKDDYQFYRGYLIFVHKNFNQSQKIFDDVQSIKSEYGIKSLYYSAFCDLFNGDYLSSSQKFERLQLHREYVLSVPYYISILYYKQERFQELIEYANGIIQKPGIRNKAQINELLRRAHYKSGNWDQLSEMLLTDAQCCNSSEEHYLAGMSLYKQNKYQMALPHLKAAALLPSKEGQNALLALAVIESNVLDKEDLLLKASLLTYDLTLRDQALLHLSRFYTEQDDVPNALKYAQRIPEQSTYFEAALQEEVAIHYEGKSYQKALQTLLRIKDEDLSYKTLYHELILLNGLKALEVQNIIQAERYLSEAALLPHNSLAQKQSMYWLAHIAFIKHDYAKSLKGLGDYIQMENLVTMPKESSLLQAQYMIAYNYLNLENYMKALEAFEIAQQLAQESFKKDADQKYEIQYEDILLRQADIFLTMGNKNKAEKYYDKAYRNAIIHGDYALYQKGKIEDLTGEPFLQIGTYQLLEEQYPNSQYLADAYMKRGEALMKLGKGKEAYDVFSEVYRSPVALNKDKFKALMNMGLIHYNQGDVETALTYYKTIFKNSDLKNAQADEALKVIEEIYLNNLKDSEGYYSFLNSIGSSLLADLDKDSIDYHLAMNTSKDNADEGVNNLNNYLQKYPNGKHQVEAILQLAKIHERQENENRAIELYKQLYEHNENYKDMAQHRIVQLLSKIEDYGDRYLQYNKEIIAENFSDTKTMSAYGRVAKAAVQSNRVVQFEKEIIKALELDVLEKDEKEQIKLAMAEYYISSRNFALAAGLLKDLSESEDDNIASRGLFLVAERMYEVSKLDQSARVLEKILQKQNSQKETVAQSLILRSRIYLRYEEFDLAKAAILPVLKQTDLNTELLMEAEQLLKSINLGKKSHQETTSPTLDLQYNDEQ